MQTVRTVQTVMTFSLDPRSDTQLFHNALLVPALNRRQHCSSIGMPAAGVAARLFQLASGRGWRPGAGSLVNGLRRSSSGARRRGHSRMQWGGGRCGREGALPRAPATAAVATQWYALAAPFSPHRTSLTVPLLMPVLRSTELCCKSPFLNWTVGARHRTVLYDPSLQTARAVCTEHIVLSRALVRQWMVERWGVPGRYVLKRTRCASWSGDNQAPGSSLRYAAGAPSPSGPPAPAGRHAPPLRPSRLAGGGRGPSGPGSQRRCCHCVTVSLCHCVTVSLSHCHCHCWHCSHHASLGVPQA